MVLATLPTDRYDTDDGLPDEIGCISLVTAFWDQVRHDLRAGDLSTFLWVEGDGEDVGSFVDWCLRTSAAMSIVAARAALRDVWLGAVAPQPRPLLDPVTLLPRVDPWSGAPVLFTPVPVIPLDVPLDAAARYFGMTPAELKASPKVKTIRRIVRVDKHKTATRWFVPGPWLWSLWQELEATDGPAGAGTAE